MKNNRGAEKIPDSKGRVDAIRKLLKFKAGESEPFTRAFIEENRGQYLHLIRFRSLEGLSVADLTAMIPEAVRLAAEREIVFFNYYIFEEKNDFLVGLATSDIEKADEILNLDGVVGRLQDELARKEQAYFSFGIGRTKSNFVSDSAEIYEELYNSSLQNLHDNVIRWQWTRFNRANNFLASSQADATIQPILHYDHHKETYSMVGGEVFIGGRPYGTYMNLLDDIPPGQDLNRVELLILEKLVAACAGAPGLLKFNASPQALIDTFHSNEKVERFIELVKKNEINPLNLRIELVEKPYEEKDINLKDVCRSFWQHGISFAADDFGVKSQSHQVVLDLGEMIKEFKLDPISFKFKAEEDHTKFLDNLAFIDYCKRLADNREAIITAEAVDEYDTLRFLIAHQVHYFQTNLFCRKMTIKRYSELFNDMQDLPEEAVRQILTSENLLRRQKRIGNIFKLSEKLGLV